MEKEIARLEEAVLYLAKVIQDGDISGVVRDVDEILGYRKENEPEPELE